MDCFVSYGLACWLLIVWYVDVVSSRYVEGHLTTYENWQFVSRFCFLSEEGQFEYMLEYDTEAGPNNLLLYYDSDTQWPAVYKSNKTCTEREQVLNAGKNQLVRLTAGPGSSAGCAIRNRTGKRITVCHHIRRFRSARERWWFIALSNCNASRGLDVRYKFLMTNGPPGDYWREHFSADEFYILPILMAVSLTYVLLLVAVAMCSVELKSRQLLHSTYKLFAHSVLWQEAGVVFQGVSFVCFASTGSPHPVTKTIGRLFEALSETLFLLLLLLLAKGYTVTRGRLRLASSVKLTVFMCLYVITYLSIFWYESQWLDPGLVLYLFESPPGYGLLALRLIAWWAFVYATIFTLKRYPEKHTFYCAFNLVGTLWFVAGPSFILAANGLIDKWVRESVVYGALHLIALAGHVAFLVLTLPSRANANFPFHVRTSQIACLESVRDENFVHHSYEPDMNAITTINSMNHRAALGDWISDVPVELFAVSRNIHMSYVSRAPSLVPRGGSDLLRESMHSSSERGRLEDRPEDQPETVRLRPDEEDIQNRNRVPEELFRIGSKSIALNRTDNVKDGAD